MQFVEWIALLSQHICVGNVEVKRFYNVIRKYVSMPFISEQNSIDSLYTEQFSDHIE